MAERSASTLMVDHTYLFGIVVKADHDVVDRELLLNLVVHSP
jgi:hypothetical protein